MRAIISISSMNFIAATNMAGIFADERKRLEELETEVNSRLAKRGMPAVVQLKPFSFDVAYGIEWKDFTAWVNFGTTCLQITDQDVANAYAHHDMEVAAQIRSDAALAAKLAADNAAACEQEASDACAVELLNKIAAANAQISRDAALAAELAAACALEESDAVLAAELAAELDAVCALEASDAAYAKSITA